VYTVLACENTAPHQACTAWRWAGEHPDSEGEHAAAAALAFDHAVVRRHPEGRPRHTTVTFAHIAGGGSCAACPTGRGPCTDTPGGPLFLCASCASTLDRELRHNLLAIGLPALGPQLTLSAATAPPPA
jgi:hypothetical protein